MDVVRKLLSVAAIALVPATVTVCYLLFGDYAALAFQMRDMEWDFLSGVITALLGVALIQVLPLADERHRQILAMLWLARIAVTLGLMLFYEGYYVVLDAQGYYYNGLRLSDPWALFEYGMGTENITALVGLLSGLTRSYSALKVIFAFIGLLGIYITYLAAARAFGREIPGLLIALGLMPSILFWSSILGKEPVTSFGIALICWGAVGYFTGRGWSALLALAIGLVIAASIRSWLAAIFIAPIIATIFLGGRVSPAVKGVTMLAAVPVFLLTVQRFAEHFAIDSAQQLIQQTNQLAKGFATGGSAQKIETQFTSLLDMILFVPKGMFAALFRPLPGEIMNPFGILAGLENAAVLALLVKGMLRQPLRAVLRQPVLLWAVLTVMAWGAFYGFASYANLGTAFRFRQMIMPVLLPLVLFLAYGPVLSRQR
ncbi:hypothetical protein LNKW23_08290 [Paralimibaculum aggregatum]|uniref:Glycosyltransferase RgtA/B/C/D-like domain-containing protein n=1 Tax=Paralimibaculum aggregatum TaxID=3036245 RepID=A0ABQ6LE42_9RHOB|nr:hypothetical protein [Limibaculum sp. NKW23]GMG81616.1 hypothetical protein LNKW23_08290 [Limibaculum sp. NKW23]